MLWSPTMPPEPDRRPSFTEGYPRVPALDALVDAFARGDFAHVRSEAPKLAESAEDAVVRAAALELRARIEPESATKWVFLGTAALLLFLVVWFYGHRLPLVGPRSPPPARSPSTGTHGERESEAGSAAEAGAEAEAEAEAGRSIGLDID